MNKRKVTVFGAGVAGLTAAHELVIRGFEVTVYDPEINLNLGPRTLDRGIGGMARSQFVIDDEQPRDNKPGEFFQLRPATDFLRDATIELAVATQNGATRVVIAEARPTDTPAKLLKIVEELKARLLLKQFRIYLPYPPGTATPTPQNNGLMKDVRFAWLRRHLEPLKVTRDELLESIVFTELETPRPNLIFFGTRFSVFPAEHGFRFFPSFYRHLFDTMKRTSIERPRDHEAGRITAFENLVPVDNLGFGRGGKATSFLVARRPIGSLEEFRTNLRNVLGELEWTGEDLERFGLKLFQYMTSCTERRQAEYENMSWSDFVGLSSYTKIMREHIEFGPQMMASLRGSRSDARTQGTIVVQLLMDHLRQGTHPDATLGGPTSSSWFDHWYDYLDGQDVKFVRGKVTHFEQIDGRPVPVVDNGETITDGYVVFALSIEAMAQLAGQLLELTKGVAAAQSNDLARLVDFLGANRTAGKLPPEDGPLRQMSGIQYYFDTEVRLWRGHTQYLDSDWGLTSISQPQFWAKRRDPSYPYRSILSVDIGIWDRPSDPSKAHPRERAMRRSVKAGDQPVTAATCDPGRLAKEVWAQIKDHHDQAFAAAYGDDALFPCPHAFALDQGLTFESSGLSGNRYPFVVNAVGKFHLRPGELADEAPKTSSRYRLLHDRFVLAGTFMKTFTRITSMESANESARHAVNAILKDARVASDRCEIWDPEDYELPELQYLKELDEELFRNKLPHFVQILGWTELPAIFHPDVSRALFEKGIRSR